MGAAAAAAAPASRPTPTPTLFSPFFSLSPPSFLSSSSSLSFSLLSLLHEEKERV